MGTSERMRDLIVQTLGSAQPALYDKTTHFDVFPTLLELLGYPQAATRKRYGCSLLDPSPRPPRRFLSGDPFKPGARTLNSFDL
jgi:arylsulfatase A-like enzyme